MQIIGQKKLLNRLNSYTAANFPHTICLFGSAGCGKHTVTKYLANKFDCNLVEITKDTDYDELINYLQKPVKTFYFIDLTIIQEKFQNKFLKFIEEPSDNVYIILLAKNETGVIPTILSRSIKFYFEQYTKDELISYKKYDNEFIYNICKTPGSLCNIDLAAIENIQKLCLTIVTKIKDAPFANTLSISQKINYKDDYNKFDFNLFLNILEYTAFNNYITDRTDLNFKIYQVINAAIKEVENRNLVKENFMISFLSDLWKETR